MNVRLLAVGIASAIMGALAASAVLPPVGDAPTLRSTGKALVGGPFTLVRHTGDTVTDAAYRGRYMLLTFGFTYCPDVCPSSLQVMAAAINRLGPAGARITPLFITVDPERDSPAQLAQYVASFHSRLEGLTGSRAQIDAVARAYRVYHKRVNDEKSAAGYTFDHSALIFLMDPSGAYVTHFAHGTSADVMADRLAKVLPR